MPLRLPPTASVLYLSVLDYPVGLADRRAEPDDHSGAEEALGRTEAVEVSDRSTPNELDLVRDDGRAYDAVVAGVFVRASSGSGRLDLAPAVVRLLQDLARATARRGQPMVAVFFGSPYVAASVPDVPAMLLTYDFSDLAEASAVRALAGEIPIGGELPIAIPGLFPVGHGLTRCAERPEFRIPRLLC